MRIFPHDQSDSIISISHNGCVRSPHFLSSEQEAACSFFSKKATINSLTISSISAGVVKAIQSLSYSVTLTSIFCLQLFPRNIINTTLSKALQYNTLLLKRSYKSKPNQGTTKVLLDILGLVKVPSCNHDSIAICSTSKQTLLRQASVGTVSCKATLVVRQELGKNDNLIFNSFGTRQTLCVHV